ncbi:hypothetical protein lerEdw1_015538 [Lerista edwardsae]|nr:hypothetical protein lerEdw1_015538 [Lerista edwardsae]
MSAEQLLQQRLLRSRLRGAQHPGGSGMGGPLPPPLLLPQPSPLSPPSPPDSPPPGTTPAEIPAGPRFPSETWCSFCRVYCPDPVCLPCGHNFCTPCIGQRLGEPKINISCLECGATARKRNLRPIKPPSLLGSLGMGVADRPKRPRPDPERVQTQLEILKQEKNSLWSQKLTGEKKIQEYMMYFQVPQPDLKAVEKLAWMIPFLQVHAGTHRDHRCSAGQFQLFEEGSSLEEKLTDFSRKGAALKATLTRFQDHVISAVEKAEIVKMVNDKVDAGDEVGKTLCHLLKTGCSDFPDNEKNTCLNACEKNPEEQIQTRLDFLKKERQELLEFKTQDDKKSQDLLVTPEVSVDVTSAIIRSDDLKCQKPIPVSSDMKGHICNFTLKTVVLKGVLKKFKDNLRDELGKGEKDGWAFGVAKESVRRKGLTQFCPEEGIWALQQNGGRYWAVTSPQRTPIFLAERLSKMRVYLDYEGEEVSFYNAENMQHIFTFNVAFTERVFPLFSVCSTVTYIKLCS